MFFSQKMLAIGFADARHGLLLHKTCGPGGCRTIVNSTGDGGVHWSQVGTLPAPHPTARLFLDSRRDAVVSFAPWFNEPWHTVTSAYATTDAGRHWHKLVLPSGSQVGAVGGGEIWAYRNRCEHRSAAACGVGLYDAPVGGGRLALVASPPTQGLAIAGLTVPGTSTMYLSAGTWFAGRSIVLVSTDYGRSWRSTATACGRGWSTTVSAPPDSSRTVWALCYSQPGAGSQIKRLRVSYDAGATWIRGTSPTNSGYGDNLVASSPTSAWNFDETEGDVFRTNDGGGSWRDVLLHRIGFSAGAAPYWFDPLSANEAWIVSSGYLHFPALFLRTTDGGRTWQRLRLPFN
jgi:photosystem II stability/assembly factor-like uncharacterized protein